MFPSSAKRLMCLMPLFFVSLLLLVGGKGVEAVVLNGCSSNTGGSLLLFFVFHLAGASMTGAFAPSAHLPAGAWLIHPPPLPFMYPPQLSTLSVVTCNSFEPYQCPLDACIGHNISSRTYMDFNSGVVRNDDTISLNSNDLPGTNAMVFEQVYTANISPTQMLVKLYMMYEGAPNVIQCAQQFFDGQVNRNNTNLYRYLWTESCPRYTDSDAREPCNVWEVRAPPFFANATMWTTGKDIIVLVTDNGGTYTAKFYEWCVGLQCLPKGGLLVPQVNGTDGTCPVY